MKCGGQEKLSDTLKASDSDVQNRHPSDKTTGFSLTDFPRLRNAILQQQSF